MADPCHFCHLARHSHYLAQFMDILWGISQSACTATTLLNSWTSFGGPAICLYCHYLAQFMDILWVTRPLYCHYLAQFMDILWGNQAICLFCHYLAQFMDIFWGIRKSACTASTLLNSWKSSGGPGNLPVLPLPCSIHGHPLGDQAICCLNYHFLTPSKVNLL